MKITVLAENTACNGFGCEHGLSLFVESGERKFLFDCGQSELFAENAEKLGVDLSEAEFMVLSHGHYDHGGGLAKFLELNKTAPVYVQETAFRPHGNADGKDIGLTFDPTWEDRLVLTKDRLELGDSMTLLSCNGEFRLWPSNSFGLTEDGQQDRFLHEQYLVVEENGRRIVLSGCSHKGILNIVVWLKPDVLAGGFHFMKLDPMMPSDRSALDNAAGALLSTGATFYTGHCTGEAPFAYLKYRMGSKLNGFSAGTVLEI